MEEKKIEEEVKVKSYLDYYNVARALDDARSPG